MSGAAGQLALTLINLGSGNLINLELSALEADNRGKIISSPRVVAFDNTKAHIEQGTDIPYIIQGTQQLGADRAVQEGGAVARRDAADHAGQPRDHDGGGAQGRDRPDVVIQGSQYPAIDTKNVTTQIAVNNGDTAVIGGIYEETINNNTTKVPFLGDIPLFGYLFKTTDRTSDEDRAPDLPHAAHHQGHGQRGALRRRATPPRKRPSVEGRCAWGRSATIAA